MSLPLGPPHTSTDKPNSSSILNICRIPTDKLPSACLEWNGLRLLQSRPFWRNPFETEEPSTPRSSSDGTNNPSPEHPKLKHPGSKWVHLFYDLAWAASFASLTGNGKFDEPLDTANYFLFFSAVLWMWTTQTLYSIRFYTNDWFHLILTFFQLFIFGMLAATTQGNDVTTYITHSAMGPTLQTTNNPATPQEYSKSKAAHLSILTMAIAFNATRLIHVAQYLRVLYCARYGQPKLANWPMTKSNRPCIPSQLQEVTLGFMISLLMMIVALVIAATPFGKTVLGASLRLGLWVGGFLVEVFFHLLVLFHWTGTANQELIPVNSDMGLYERLQTITTIILGEGINGIASTLSKVLVAPGAGIIAGINIVGAALVILFIAYIYFEGPYGGNSPALTSRRYLPWLMAYYPFLASTVLLLIGMKHQFLLTGFLSSLFKTTETFNEKLGALAKITTNITEWKINVDQDMSRFLIKRGVIWKDEVQNLLDTTNNKTADGNVIDTNLAVGVWVQRLSLTVVTIMFKKFNEGDDSISDDLQGRITEYYQNLEQVIEDVTTTIPNDRKEAVYFKILSGLLDGPVLNTRCIIAFAGLLLISLGLQDISHKSRDWYQRVIILFRFAMGTVLALLSLLNIGKYQQLFVLPNQRHERAGVLQWLEACWVLPTIAIAYGIQAVIETVVASYAKKATKRDANGIEQEQAGQEQTPGENVEEEEEVKVGENEINAATNGVTELPSSSPPPSVHVGQPVEETAEPQINKAL